MLKEIDILNKEWNRLKEQAKPEQPCPCCGACPHCGSGYNPQQWYPYPPNHTTAPYGITWTTLNPYS